MSPRAWLRRHPELSVLAVSALAWALLLAPASMRLPGVMDMSRAATSATAKTAAPMQMPAMESSMSMSAGMQMSGSMNMPGMSRSISGMNMPTGGAAHRRASAGTTMDWTFPMLAVMVLAMMLPATTGSVRQVGARSLWCRRRRAAGEWIAGYVGVWLAASAVIVGLRAATTAAGVLTTGPLALVIGLVLAAAWQLTPFKRAALNGCHRTRPLALRGVRADWDCFAWGTMIGRECVISCGPMMAAMTLGATSSLTVMLGLTAVVLTERFRHRTPRRASAVVLAVLAVVAV